jgi:hypothetical protein
MTDTGLTSLLMCRVEEIDRLPLGQKDQITAEQVTRSPKVSLTQAKGTLRLKLLFGGGSHWTMIYDLDERPIGCEFHKVRFRRLGETIWVYPLRDDP